MTPKPATFPGYHFPAAIIRNAVWLYHVFGLSLCEVELLLAERGIVVTHESIRRHRQLAGPKARKLTDRQ